jgi:hypothetical protein
LRNNRAAETLGARKLIVAPCTGHADYSEMIVRRSCATRVPVPEVRKKSDFANIFARVIKKRRIAFSANSVTKVHTEKIAVYVLHIMFEGNDAVPSLPGRSAGDRTDAKLSRAAFG